MAEWEERFWATVREAPDGCWLWTGTCSASYGQFSVDGSLQRAPRLAYELVVGVIPAGLELDHLCRTPGCVNPAHLEPVTHRENVLRGVGFAAVNARKTHCVRGHPLSGANVYRPARGGRECKACRAAAERRRKERLRWTALGIGA